MSNYDEKLPKLALNLGKETKYKFTYDRSLLQAVPRQLNRDTLDLNNSLPFTQGADIWTLYELSWLNEKGLPQVAIGTVEVDFMSKNIIESKSFKLYLNSFNQSKFSDWNTVCSIMQTDLQECAQGDVRVNLHKLDDVMLSKVYNWNAECIDEQDIEIENYQYAPEYLENCADNQNIVSESLVSHLLKSNCLITNQPDWGSLFIQYKGAKISQQALIKYIVSLREHNEFHEQCVERIFCDIMRYAKPENLLVYARYTRRGGLDINPYRSNFSVNLLNERLIRQ